MEKFVYMLLALRMTIKQYHWLAKGYEEHILADRLEEELDDYMDEAAELSLVVTDKFADFYSKNVLEKARKFIDEVAVLEGDNLFTISGLITTIMGECRKPVEEDLLKQPFGDYLGRLSNLLMRKLYLIDIQNKRVKDEQN
jgi:hypothetical protein